jgi:ascorbate-specific PTS system EIIC-type component UlaA
MNKQNTLTLSAFLLILFAAFTRLFPHYPNFTAIGAIAIFGGSVINDKKLAFLLPLAAMLISDVCLELFTGVQGFYGNGQYFIYGAFMLITWLATYIRKKNVMNIAFAAVWSGLIFFIISNFGQWLCYPGSSNKGRS